MLWSLPQPRKSAPSSAGASGQVFEELDEQKVGLLTRSKVELVLRRAGVEIIGDNKKQFEEILLEITRVPAGGGEYV